MNRFTTLPSPAYVPQFVPEVLDTNLFSQESNRVNDAYNTALQNYSNNFIDVKYHNNLQEDASRVIGEFESKQDEIVNTLLKDKDVNKATKMMSGLYKDYNQSLTSGDLRYLQQSHDKYATDMKTITEGIKDPVSRQMEIDRYNRNLPTSLKNELGKYNTFGDPNLFELPDVQKAVLDIGKNIKPNTVVTVGPNGEKWTPQFDTSGNFIGAWSNDKGEKKSIETGDAYQIIKSMIEGDPILQSKIESAVPYFGREVMDNMIEQSILGGANAFSFTENIDKSKLVNAPQGDNDSTGGGGPEPNPAAFIVESTMWGIMSADTKDGTSLDNSLAAVQIAASLDETTKTDLQVLDAVMNINGDTPMADVGLFNVNDDGYVNTMPESYFLDANEMYNLQFTNPADYQTVAGTQNRLREKNFLASQYNIQLKESKKLKNEAYTRVGLSTEEIELVKQRDKINSLSVEEGLNIASSIMDEEEINKLNKNLSKTDKFISPDLSSSTLKLYTDQLWEDLSNQENIVIPNSFSTAKIKGAIQTGSFSDPSDYLSKEEREFIQNPLTQEVLKNSFDKANKEYIKRNVTKTLYKNTNLEKFDNKYDELVKSTYREALGNFQGVVLTTEGTGEKTRESNPAIASASKGMDYINENILNTGEGVINFLKSATRLIHADTGREINSNDIQLEEGVYNLVTKDATDDTSKGFRLYPEKEAQAKLRQVGYNPNFGSIGRIEIQHEDGSIVPIIIKHEDISSLYNKYISSTLGISGGDLEFVNKVSKGLSDALDGNPSKEIKEYPIGYNYSDKDLLYVNLIPTDTQNPGASQTFQSVFITKDTKGVVQKTWAGVASGTIPEIAEAARQYNIQPVKK